MAAHASIEVGVPTLLFSLELSKTEVVERLLVAGADMDADRLRRGLIEYSEWKNKIYPAGARLRGAPLVIDDTVAPTLSGFRSKLQTFLGGQEPLRETR